MSGHLLDTNIVGLAVRGDGAVLHRLSATPIGSVAISVVTLGEIAFGLARRPEASRLHAAVREFLARVDALAWTEAVAWHYGRLRETMRALGLALSPLDMQIAAHALQATRVLVTADRAFRAVPELTVENWTETKR